MWKHGETSVKHLWNICAISNGHIFIYIHHTYHTTARMGMIWNDTGQGFWIRIPAGMTINHPWYPCTMLGDLGCFSTQIAESLESLETDHRYTDICPSELASWELCPGTSWRVASLAWAREDQTRTKKWADSKWNMLLRFAINMCCESRSQISKSIHQLVGKRSQRNVLTQLWKCMPWGEKWW